MGRWLLPTGSASVQARALVVGIAGLLTVSATLVGLAGIIISPANLLNFRDSVNAGYAEIAVLFVVAIVLAPAAVFRTRNRARTEQLLTDSAAPSRHWDRATIQFDAVLAGSMLAGVFYFPLGALACFGLALILRAALVARRVRRGVPDARYVAVLQAFSSLVSCAVAYAIVLPLTPVIIAGGSFVPFLVAGAAAMYAGLGVNAVDRWVRGNRAPWSLALDVLDPRRLIIAAVSATFAWLVILCSSIADAWGDQVASIFVGIGAFFGAWILLWLVSLLVWRFEAMRILRRWSEHQARVVARIADGTLDPSLAARAGVAIVGRISMSVFGADRVAVRRGSGDITAFGVSGDGVDVSATLAGRHREWRLQSDPLAARPDWIYLADLNWPGRFLVRTRFVPEWFRAIALETLVVPDVADVRSGGRSAFSELFDEATGLPSRTAFLGSIAQLRTRCDARPAGSLAIAVYGIDDFGSMGHTALGRELLSRLTGELSVEFAEIERFVAYEAPGRVWIAVLGSDVRESIARFHAVRESADIRRLVSMGTAVYQVDAIDECDLIDIAEERLGIDASVNGAEGYGGATLLDLASDLRAAADEGAVESFVTPITSVDRRTSDAVLVSLSWPHRFGSADLSDPDAFMKAVNRQVPAARIAAELLCESTHLALADLDFVGGDQAMALVAMPSVLLHPEAGKDALPNIVAGEFDRIEAARTVLLFDTVPKGSGQVLRMLVDRGFKIAVTSGAVATASPADLAGWQRWGVVLNSHLLDGPRGVDSLAIQQSITALAGAETRVVGEISRGIDPAILRAQQIEWVLDMRRTREQGLDLAS